MSNIDYEKIRDHLLAILWHDFKSPQDREDEPILLDRELGWQLINLLDGLIKIKNINNE